MVGAIMIVLDARVVKQDARGALKVMTPKLQRALADFSAMRPDSAPPPAAPGKARGPVAARAADRPPPASVLPLGSVFAGCRVVKRISHGDMGVVYQAEELALQRPVALKLILPEYSRDERGY